MKAVKNIH